MEVTSTSGQLLGFLRSEDKENFQIERIYYTLSIIDHESYQLLINAVIQSKKCVVLKGSYSDPECYYYNQTQTDCAGLLLSLGLIFLKVANLGNLAYEITDFGKYFVNYSNPDLAFILKSSETQ